MAGAAAAYHSGLWTVAGCCKMVVTAPAACRAAQQAGCVSTTPLPSRGSRRAAARAQPRDLWHRGDTDWRREGPARQLITASAAAAATSTSMARPRSADVLGVVILHTGTRSPTADDLLLSVASMYGRVTRREVVAVANTATLEAAVRGCMEDGATKVMIVPYCASLTAQPDANPALALAEVQSHLPGISCMMGDTIAMDQLLAEFIEGQVRIVEGKRAAVPERWFEPAQQAQRPTNQAAAAPYGDSLHTGSSGLPHTDEWQGGSSSQAKQQVWSDAVDVAQEQRPSFAQAAPTEQAAASSASFPSSGAAPRAWSDDMASVLVVDYRENGEAAADGSAAAPAVEPAAAPEPATWAESVHSSGIVGSSFDLGDAAGAAGGETDWSSHLSGYSSYTGIRSDADSDSEGGSSGHATTRGGSFESSIVGSTFSDSSSQSGEAAGQPLYEEALERRLAHMEEQLQHITTLLESQPPAQQAQQAQQAPAWQSAMFEQQAAELVENEVEAALYSPQQLAFLARKRAAKRARAGRS